MSDWALYNTDLPAVIVNDLKINYGNHEVWAGTYGRGIWKTTKADEPSAVAQLHAAAQSAQLRIVPDPNAGNCTLQTGRKSLAGKKMMVSIMDNAGRTAWSGTMPVDADGNVALSATGLLPGTYTVRTSIGASCKMQIMK
jgi:hypothetical protein